MIESERLEGPAHRLSPTAASTSTPATIAVPFSTPESAVQPREGQRLRGDQRPALEPLCRSASRAACAAGSTTSQA